MSFLKKSLVFLSVLGVIVGFPEISSGRVSNQVYVMPPSGNIPNWGPVNVNSSGTAVTGILTHTNGGTDVSSPGTSGNVLTSNGTNWISSPPAGSSPHSPTRTNLTTTGTTVGYLFTLAVPATLATGDVYQDANSNNHTSLVTLTAQSGQVLFMTGAGVPPVSGTLTRISGSGTVTVSYSSDIPLAQYTTPVSPSPLYLKVRMVGSGGGGGSNTTAGGSGLTTFFGALFLSANGGGAGGGPNAPGGAGGTALSPIPAGAVGFSIDGGSGSASTTVPSGGAMSGAGGNSAFGGAGGGSQGSGTAGRSAAANSGSGASGAGCTGGTNTCGAAGGAGAYVDVVIPSPAATYVYAVPAGGAGGTGGAANGGTGGNGAIYIEEDYQ